MTHSNADMKPLGIQKSQGAGMIRARACVLVALVFLCTAIASQVLAQTGASNCRQNATEVATQGGTLRIRDYLCTTDKGARVRVQLHRIDDTLAHATQTNAVPPELEEMLGNATVISNPVSNVFADLMKRFGEERDFPCLQFRQFAPGQHTMMNSERNCGGGTLRRTLGGWRDEWNQGNDTFPAIQDIRSLFLNDILPPEYQESDRGRVWRYMTATDLEDLPTKIDQTNEIIRLDGDTSKNIEYPKELALMQHVADGKLPKGFAALIATNHVSSCDDTSGWTLSYTPRPMLVEVALIENLSQQTVTLSDMMGSQSRTQKLRRSRRLKDIQAGQDIPLSDQSFTLAPRERAIIFQRLSFVTDQQIYSFDLHKFDYGPAEFLRSFAVDGERINLAERSHNATLLTMSTDGGSCPYLYTHKGDEWINHGKVLHEAKGVDLKGWDDKEFDGFQGVFRLAELEPELGIIDQALLDVTLRSGEVVTLTPDRAALAKPDGTSEKIYMYESVDINFELPDAIHSGDVVSSRLRLLGYYERYSTLYQTAGLLGPQSMTAKACAMPNSNDNLAQTLALAD